MKTRIVVICLSLFLFGFQLGKQAGLSGAWRLDLTKSVNLPESFKHVDSYVMHVRQTRDSIVTTADMKGNGQEVHFPITAYALDGSEVFRADTVRKSKRWMKVSWISNGKKFAVDARVELHPGPAPAETYTQRDVWELLDRNTLQISVVQKTPEGAEKHTERRILHRVK